MNLFFLEEDVESNANAHCDQHVIKIPVEIAQLLYTSIYNSLGKDTQLYKTAVKTAPLTLSSGERGYKPTHIHSPLVAWVSKNFLRVVNYGLSLCKEYSWRYGKQHAVQRHLLWLKENAPKCEESSEIVLSVAGKGLQMNCSLEYVRNYYRSKASVTFKIPMSYTRRSPPTWLNLPIQQQIKKNGDVVYKLLVDSVDLACCGS